MNTSVFLLTYTYRYSEYLIGFLFDMTSLYNIQYCTKVLTQRSVVYILVGGKKKHLFEICIHEKYRKQGKIEFVLLYSFFLTQAELGKFSNVKQF